MAHLQLLEFYAGCGCDVEGRSLEEILSWSDAQLERVHDYIQWLFPTPRPSQFNPLAPVLDRETAERFQSSDELQLQVLRATERMLAFFGLTLARCQVAPTVDLGPRYSARRTVWQGNGNHNFLRISRMLESLANLGLGRYAVAFYLCLERLHAQRPRAIPYSTLEVWRKSVGLGGPPPRAPGLWERVRKLFMAFAAFC